MTENTLYFNGINGATGAYLLPPQTPEELTQRFIHGAGPPENRSELAWRARQKAGGFLGVKDGVDPTKLAEAGWGIIFAQEGREWVPAIMDALKELLDLRHGQAGERYHEYTGDKAVGPGESKTVWLARQGIGPGPADPDKVPYYLLIVGNPETIPYRFQYQLDVQYAVGRIHFDTLEEYAQYARSVVLAESGKVALPRRASFFGVQNLDDPATAQGAKLLVEPLAQKMAGVRSDWTVETVAPADARKARLVQLLGGAQAPALLFTESHGMYFPPDDPEKRQVPHGGALLCGDWPGPLIWQKEIPHDHYLAAEDVGDDARLLGMIAFHFACFGAGTPRLDDFASGAAARAELAPHAFVARLPQRLLGHPKGGALAVIGHVERAFPASFVWDQAGPQLAVFESTLGRLMKGEPVGLALEYFNERYSELSTVLSGELEEIDFGKQPNLPELTGMWMANNDARNYAIVGDPAVRLPLASNGTDEARPTLAPVEIRGPAGPGGVPTAPARPGAAPSGGTPGGAAQPGPANAGAGADQPAAGQSPPGPVAGQGAGGSGFEQVSRMQGFSPWPGVPADADKTAHPELYAAWVGHIEAGYRNNDTLFTRILNAFLRSHYSTVIMYWVLFAVGVGFFVTGVVMALVKGQSVTGLVFGGLSVVSFLTFFVTRPSQALEENLMFISWLGMLYNSYWTHLSLSFDRQTAQSELDKATADAISQIKDLIASHAAAVKKRPGLMGGNAAGEAPAAADGQAKPDQ
jgi:hypothetical protein